MVPHELIPLEVILQVGKESDAFVAAFPHPCTLNDRILSIPTRLVLSRYTVPLPREGRWCSETAVKSSLRLFIENLEKSMISSSGDPPAGANHP